MFFHSHRCVLTLNVNVLVSLWKVHTIPLDLSSYTIASQGEHTAKNMLHAILMHTLKSASCSVRDTLILLPSLKPSSAELYFGQIAPEMSIGLFLTSHGNGLRAHFRTFYAI